MTYRIGVVEYILGRPLVWGLEDGGGVSLATAVPSRIGEMLASGELDAGLLPVAQLVESPELVALPGPCVACDGPVESIRLYHRRPLGQIRRLALDTSSRTSAILAQIVLAEVYGVRPEVEHTPPDLAAMLDTCDAAMLIGDPALRAGDAADYLDLGSAWQRMTALPCVFALWGLRATDAELQEILLAAWREGKRHTPAIAAEESARRGLEPAQMERYLSHSIHYDLDERTRRGLDCFLGHASALGLLPAGAEVRFLG